MVLDYQSHMVLNNVQNVLKTCYLFSENTLFITSTPLCL